MRYDVIIVGAGPAGSTTARESARRGLSVLLLDKAEFPRDKPCGGGVTKRAVELLPFDISPVVERVATGMQLTLRRRHGFTRYSPEVLVYLTQRRRFDAFLLERAVEAGTTLYQRVNVREIHRHKTHVAVRSNGHLYEGSTLVAADGANGQTARLAGVEVKLGQQIALEGNITPPGGLPERWQDVLALDIGDVPGGYGWLFPKGDHVNIGLGGWKYIGPSMRERLDGLVRFYGMDPSALWGLRGYHVPHRRPGSSLGGGNVLLVGDAAGLVDPFTNEGIHSAIWSGRAAARHIAAYVGGHARDLEGYVKEVERVLVPDLTASRQFHDVFHLTPGLWVGIERRKTILWKLTCDILSGDKTYAGVLESRRKLAFAVDLISDLVRVVPFLGRVAGLRDSTTPNRFFRGRARRPGNRLHKSA